VECGGVGMHALVTDKEHTGSTPLFLKHFLENSLQIEKKYDGVGQKMIDAGRYHKKSHETIPLTLFINLNKDSMLHCSIARRI
jgi:hypothetical protein